MSVAAFCVWQLDRLRCALRLAHWDYKRRLYVATREDDLAGLYAAVAGKSPWV